MLFRSPVVVAFPLFGGIAISVAASVCSFPKVISLLLMVVLLPSIGAAIGLMISTGLGGAVVIVVATCVLVTTVVTNWVGDEDVVTLSSIDTIGVDDGVVVVSAMGTDSMVGARTGDVV